jgi:uncharacterized protein (TIGR02996 family)
MDQADAFLQSIADDPADDAVRLVFADWLEEQGESGRVRAEFIRVQYALLDLPADDPRRPQLEERQRHLLLAHEPEWTASLSALLAATAICGFHRGFVEKIAVAPQVLASEGAAIVSRFPIRELQLLPFGWGFSSAAMASTILRLADANWLGAISGLDLSRINLDESALHNLLCSPGLSRLASLSIQRTAAACRVLARAPFLARLNRLTLTAGANAAPPEAVELLGSGALANLTHLELSGRNVSPRELEALANALPVRLGSLSLVNVGAGIDRILDPLADVRLPGLLDLDLSRNSLGSPAARSLARSVFLESVENLDLSTNLLGDEGIGWLARSNHFGRLRKLNLSGNLLGPAGCRALASGSFPALRSLHLRNNRIGDEGLRCLVRGPDLAGLKALHASYNRITSLGALELAEAFPPWLEVLDLSWNRIGDSGAIALVSESEAHRLAALDLSYGELGDSAARALAGAPLLVHLHTLNLASNRIGDAGLVALLGSPGLMRLEALNLGHNRIGDSGAAALLESPLFRRLTALHLHGTAISGAQRQRMRQEFRGILG